MKAFQCERCGNFYTSDFLVGGKVTIEDKGSDYIINLSKAKRSEPELSKAFRIKEIDLCLNCLIGLLKKRESTLRRTL